MFANHYYDIDDFLGDDSYHYMYPHRRRAQEQREAAFRRQQQQLLRKKQQQQQRQQQQRQQQQRQQRRSVTSRNENETDDYDLVWGSDGRLYYVNKPYRQQQQHARPGSITMEDFRSPTEDDSSEEEESFSSSTSSDDDSASDAGEDAARSAAMSRRSHHELPRAIAARTRTSTRTRTNTGINNATNGTALSRRTTANQRIPRRITVTVEDASDSECESEFDSPWRNRRPSPGQWMEPVESYHE